MFLPVLAGCTRHSKDEHYYLIATNINLPYWKAANAGFQKAAGQYGVSAEMRGTTTFDPQGEVAEFRTVVARKPAGILVSVASAELMGPEITAALGAGIPVITMDSDAPASGRLYFIGTNNLQAGRLGGQRVAAKLNGKGNVAFFSIPGQPNIDERLKGYKDALSHYPGIKIVDVFDMKGDSGLAMDQTRDYLSRTGANRVDAIVCLEAASGRDVAEAFRRANVKDRLLVAMDTDQTVLQGVKDGTIDSTISQKPFTMALVGLKALDDIHHYPLKPLAQDYSLNSFAPIPTFIDTGVSLIDKSNVDTMLNIGEDKAP
ncbi:ribose transport system substrate-binding protein [Edaphobacter lichenicola]|uniref:Ribose transport system substrate-binding protein n=2 Tax=Tunturiibacter TaxID=3154218 RepID=A0A7W8JDT8_9BACT|nr:ribose transport system substrate-binding protein [Edaphobacter lichenicola]